MRIPALPPRVSPARFPSRRSRWVAACCGLLLAAALPVGAQVPGFSVSKQYKLDRIGETHWRATGQVEMEREDMRFFADVVDFYSDTDVLEASGNVVFVSSDSRIAADSATFNTRTRTGTFHNASGVSVLGDHPEKKMFGTQEADAYFYGETIEKLGPDKYGITRGGFTTCVQPTPRWEIVTTRATVTVEKHAVLRNSVLRVKGVPLLYLPILYYPINKQDRSTGFLIPTYGVSTIKGQTLSNAFFWAINRSQDATVFYDWYSKTGQGLGGEYRYVASPGNDGQIRTYWLDERASSYVSGGTTVETPARRSYEIRGFAQQRLPFRLYGRANVDYFSDVTVQQLYQQNLYDASRRQRLYGGNLAGSWGGNRLSFTYNRNEIFYGATDSQVYGSAPRLTFDRASRRIGQSPVFFSLAGDYNNILRATKFANGEFDQGLSRVEARPVVTVPFNRWPFLSVNGAASYFLTWYSESLGPNGFQRPEAIWRNYLDLRADAVGPTLTRVWNTPDNGYAEKFKHIVEPSFSVGRTTLIDNYDEIVKLESNDYTLGGTTRLQYGLTNRFLARRRRTNQAREFLNVTVFQSYYTDPRASQYDPSFGTSFAGRPPSNFSPIALGTRVSPTDRINGALRLEYDYQISSLQSVRANGGYAVSEVLQVNGGWSRRRYASGNSFLVDNFLNLVGNAKTRDGRFGGTYQFDYDFRRSTLLQQRVIAYYAAQCCGVNVEYQRYDYPQFDPRFPVKADRRFMISFTLAGIGTFSNPFGSFGGSGTSGRY